MKISKYFTIEELTASQDAVRKGIPNIPSTEELRSLTNTAMRMDEIREMLLHPIIVHSGFRSIRLNESVGGSKTSDHCKGLAVDFICPGYGSVREVFSRIKESGIGFDQLIEEGGAWVHVGFGPRMRRQCLKATFSNGVASYQEVK